MTDIEKLEEKAAGIVLEASRLNRNDPEHGDKIRNLANKAKRLIRETEQAAVETMLATVTGTKFTEGRHAKREEKK